MGSISVEEALKAKYVVISLLGSHAGESAGKMVERKQGEVTKAGRSFWLHRSSGAAPRAVQELRSLAEEEGSPVLPCIFVSPRKVGSETKGESEATVYSGDQEKECWAPVPKGIRPTGSFHAKVNKELDKYPCAYAIVLGEIGVSVLDPDDYLEFDPKSRETRRLDLTRQGRTTICCVKRQPGDRGTPHKDDKRLVLGVGKVLDGVWLRPQA